MLSSRSPDPSRLSFGAGYAYPGAVRTPPSVSRQVSSSPSSSTRPFTPVKMPVRQNKYFLPGDGIRREVITADICRYLGNDALVKPGTYEGRDGFWVTAYRALTSDMIADLKADSLRWAAEQAQIDPRAAVPYRDSRTHEFRQAHGPTAVQAQGQPPASSQGRMDPSYGAAAPGYYHDASYGPSSGYPNQPPGQQGQYPGQGYGGNPEYQSGTNPDYQYASVPYASTSSNQPRTMPPYTTHAQYSGGTVTSTYPGSTTSESTYSSGSEPQGYSQHQTHPGMPRQPPQQHNARGTDPYGRGGTNY